MLKLSYKMLGMRALTKQYGVGHSDDLAFIFPFRQISFPLQLSGQRVFFKDIERPLLLLVLLTPSKSFI
jgi:hypothetical protein